MLWEDFGLIGEFNAKFAADPPCQPALPRARREYDSELSGNHDMFGDNLGAAIGQVGDRAVARQTGPELDFGEASALPPFALASICQHVDPQLD
jgi:hypothetical protein